MTATEPPGIRPRSGPRFLKLACLGTASSCSARSRNPRQQQPKWHLPGATSSTPPTAPHPTQPSGPSRSAAKATATTSRRPTPTAPPTSSKRRQPRHHRPKEDRTGPDGIPRHYTSARLNTQNRFAQKYGRFEASIQLPTGKGIWPAFWLLGDNIPSAGWPKSGEIDILETIGAPSTMYSNPPRPRLQWSARHLRQIRASPRPGRRHRLPSLRRRVGTQRHQVLLRRPPHRPSHPSRPSSRHHLGLRPPLLHHSEPRRRRQLARQPRRNHRLPATDAGQLRPRLHQKTKIPRNHRHPPTNQNRAGHDYDRPSRQFKRTGLSTSGLTRFLNRARIAVGLHGEVDVLLTDDATLRRLNKTFRGKNKSTDVLSFPAADELSSTSPATSPSRSKPPPARPPPTATAS